MSTVFKQGVKPPKPDADFVKNFLAGTKCLVGVSCVFFLCPPFKHFPLLDSSGLLGQGANFGNHTNQFTCMSKTYA